VKKQYILIILAALFVIFYHSAPYFSNVYRPFLYLFIVSPFIVVYLAYAILKYGRQPESLSDERLYEE
jgi:multisubunit Na+/H+ antiporter MnhG subunit